MARGTQHADRRLREEALLVLQHTGAIMEIAREISAALRESNIHGAVIGGIAVTLHGHVRTTVDVDVFVSATDDMAAALARRGFVFEPQRREFVKQGVPVHLVTADVIGQVPRSLEHIDDVITVSLPDLVEMKLRSGTRHLLRAQDLADVIGLIRANGLTSEFARRLSKDLRPDFRRLVREIRRADGA